MRKELVKECQSSKARVLQLSLKNSCGVPIRITTPFVLLQSRNLAFYHLCPETIPTDIPAALLQWSPLLDSKGALEGDHWNVHKWCGIEKKAVFMIHNGVHSITGSSANDRGLVVDKSSGRTRCSMREVADVIKLAQPEMFCCPGDIPEPFEGQVSRNRLIKAQKRSLKFMDEITRDLEGTGIGIIAPLNGGDDLQLRTSCADQMVAFDAVEGFYLEDVIGDEEKKKKLLEASVTEEIRTLLKPILWRNAAGIEDMLFAVENGCDLIESEYAEQLAQMGCALVFPLSFDGGVGKINLRDVKYERDGTMGFGVECRCYTCKTHHNAYLYHLLNTHEMLAHVLLQIHNVHHMYRFFETLQEHIVNGTFPEYKAKVLQFIRSN